MEIKLFSIEERYKNYDQRVIECLRTIVSTIKDETNNRLPSFLHLSLDMLADELELYFRTTDELRHMDMTMKDKTGRTIKNPNIQVMHTCHDKILNMLKEFGFTRMSKVKMNKLQSGKDDDMTTLEALLS